MKKILLSDTLWGAAATLLVLSLFWMGHPFLETLELKFFDFRSKLRQSPPSKTVSIIAIDDDSLAKLGRWPWPRSLVAKLLDTVASYQPKVIGLDILFSEPEKNPGLEAIGKLANQYEELVGAKKIKQAKDVDFIQTMEASMDDLDQDSKLARSIAVSSITVMPLFFDLSQNTGAQPSAVPEAIAASALPIGDEKAASEAGLEASQATFPLTDFAQGAVGVGHVNVLADVDGTIRKELASIAYGEDFYPSFSVEIIRRYMGLSPEQVRLFPGSKLLLGRTEIPMDGLCSFLLTYNGPTKTFTYYSFFDVLQGKIAPEAFKDKIVLIGPTAVGVGTQYVTPVTASFPSVELVATALENLIQKKFLTRPPWARTAELASILVMGLFLILVLPRLKALWGALLSMVLLAFCLGAGVYLFVANDQWIKVSYPAFLLAAGYTLITSKRFLVTERRKELVEASQIETNKMLGLSFQGQGMLDLAFDKFRNCPVDDTVKDLLYNLALDFERKRQYNKAVAVYEHLAKTDSKYKDIQKKMEMLRKASEGAVFGGGVGKSKESTIMVEGASMAPTLGRYEVVKELGRGAMGIVYLGKDPKINRQVAIKTMRFEDEVSPDQLKQLKERFFREAESAGNLNHPNIVRIFDAGEEQDICYIAMELLDGHDLKVYTEKEKMLPVPTVLDYMTKICDAIDFAHQAGVVHRDIKPANIMLLKDGTLRVTDFGIARIQSSSKTATGTVMGTPSYMSPEQIAGKKVDGRADIFSTGVMLFELLTGEKPFKGGESIGTLLFQIASDPHPDPLSIRPDLPPGVKAVIDKALKKNSDERYQRGSEMANDLRALYTLVTGNTAPAAPKAKPAAETSPAAKPEAEPPPSVTPEADLSTLGGQPPKPTGEPPKVEAAPKPQPTIQPAKPEVTPPPLSIEPSSRPLQPKPAAIPEVKTPTPEIKPVIKEKSEEKTVFVAPPSGIEHTTKPFQPKPAAIPEVKAPTPEIKPVIKEKSEEKTVFVAPPSGIEHTTKPFQPKPAAIPEVKAPTPEIKPAFVPQPEIKPPAAEEKTVVLPPAKQKILDMEKTLPIISPEDLEDKPQDQEKKP